MVAVLMGNEDTVQIFRVMTDLFHAEFDLPCR